MKFQAPFERIKEYNSSPEVSLYKAVITQAIIDATNTSLMPEAKSIERDAKRWIFGNDEYFQKICHMAGIDPGFVIKITQEAIRLNHTKREARGLGIKQRSARQSRKSVNNKANTG